MSSVFKRAAGQSITIVDLVSGSEVNVKLDRDPKGHYQLVVDAPDTVSVFRTEKREEPIDSA